MHSIKRCSKKLLRYVRSLGRGKIGVDQQLELVDTMFRLTDLDKTNKMLEYITKSVN